MRAATIFVSLVAAVAVSTLSGCAVIWDALNREFLKRHVEEVLHKCSLTTTSYNYHMLGSTRAGHYEFSTTPEQIAAIVDTLHLKQITGYNNEGPILGLETKDECQLYQQFKLGADKLRVYMISGAPKELILSDGSAFSYLYLFHDIRSNKACVLVCYAYG